MDTFFFVICVLIFILDMAFNNFTSSNDKDSSEIADSSFSTTVSSSSNIIETNKDYFTDGKLNLLIMVNIHFTYGASPPHSKLI